MTLLSIIKSCSQGKVDRCLRDFSLVNFEVRNGSLFALLKASGTGDTSSVGGIGEKLHKDLKLSQRNDLAG